MKCEICGTTESSHWRRNICNSCYQKQYRINNHDVLISYDESVVRRFNKAVRLAKKRKVDWFLTIEEFSGLCGKPCFYCENKLSKIVSVGIGLDRLDSSKGYEKYNVVSCCKSCNLIKNDILTADEMKQVVGLLLKLRNK